MEKLISFTGTPTVVWRRTGEICLVGLEFTLLTEWGKEDLVSGKKYIYEASAHSIFSWHSLKILKAFRESISRGVLGKLRFSRLRKYDTVRLLPLRVTQTLWRTHTLHVLLFNTEGYFRSAQHGHWFVHLVEVFFDVSDKDLLGQWLPLM